MNTRHLISLLLLPLLLSGCGRQRRFDEAERAFRQNAETEAYILEGIEQSYYRASSQELERLHARYLRDGTFALLDSLDDAQQRLAAILVENCTRHSIPRLTDCLTLHFNTSRRITDAEIPFIYKALPPPGVLPTYTPVRCR